MNKGGQDWFLGGSFTDDQLEKLYSSSIEQWCDCEGLKGILLKTLSLMLCCYVYMIVQLFWEKVLELDIGFDALFIDYMNPDIFFLTLTKKDCDVGVWEFVFVWSEECWRCILKTGVVLYEFQGDDGF